MEAGWGEEDWGRFRVRQLPSAKEILTPEWPRLQRAGRMLLIDWLSCLGKMMFSVVAPFRCLHLLLPSHLQEALERLLLTTELDK